MNLGTYCDVVERVEEQSAPTRLQSIHSSGSVDAYAEMPVTIAVPESSPSPQVTWLEAQYAFEPQDKGEMALEVGQRVELIQSDDPEWWYGRNEHGQEG
jgi:hypothetical protein